MVNIIHINNEDYASINAFNYLIDLFDHQKTDIQIVNHIPTNTNNAFFKKTLESKDKKNFTVNFLPLKDNLQETYKSITPTPVPTYLTCGIKGLRTKVLERSPFELAKYNIGPLLIIPDQAKFNGLNHVIYLLDLNKFKKLFIPEMFKELIDQFGLYTQYILINDKRGEQAFFKIDLSDHFWEEKPDLGNEVYMMYTEHLKHLLSQQKPDIWGIPAHTIPKIGRKKILQLTIDLQIPFLIVPDNYPGRFTISTKKPDSISSK